MSSGVGSFASSADSMSASASACGPVRSADPGRPPRAPTGRASSGRRGRSRTSTAAETATDETGQSRGAMSPGERRCRETGGGGRRRARQGAPSWRGPSGRPGGRRTVGGATPPPRCRPPSARPSARSAVRPWPRGASSRGRSSPGGQRPQPSQETGATLGAARSRTARGPAGELVEQVARSAGSSARTRRTPSVTLRPSPGDARPRARAARAYPVAASTG